MKNLYDHQHIFLSFIHNKILRNSNIVGTLNQEIIIPHKDTEMVGNNQDTSPVQNFDTIDSMYDGSESQ